MKIALIGNMNNNHFSMMRYCRDLGHEAFLYLYENDGVGVNSHFIPENDTWEFERWEKYIIQTNLLYNGSFYGIFFLLKNRKEIKSIFNDFDLIIGNGFSPAMAFICGFRIDLFFPYSYGCEFLNYYKKRRFNLWSFLSNKLHALLMKLGLVKSTNLIGTIDYTEKNLSAYKKNGILHKVKPIPIPMVYRGDSQNIFYSSDLIDKFKNKTKNFYPVIFSHLSFRFDTPRGNVEIINGFYQFLKKYNKNNPVLVLIEYGPDVNLAKDIISKLGIEDNIVWLDGIYARKEIMQILKKVDFGISEIGGRIWGGVGWEFLAAGVPFIHDVGFSKEEFEAYSGLSFPPIFNATNPREIRDILLDNIDDKNRLKNISTSMIDWFDSNCGKSHVNNIIKDLILLKRNN